MDLLIKHLGPESRKQATSTKAANPRNPVRALERIWDRLDERYGAPEMVMAALQQRLATFPKISPGTRDAPKLYELADLLAEIEGLKEDLAYGTPLAYFDSSAGVNPIVGKLPTGLQEKWTTCAVKYNEHHGTHFPPFAEFSQFVQQQSKIRNNPCFRFDSDPSLAPAKKEKLKPTVSVRKTEVGDQPASPSRSTHIKETCPIHKTKHPLTECKGFRAKPIWDRRNILKKNGGCFRCCHLGHMRSDCKASVSCDCGSKEHPTALHVNDGKNVNPCDEKQEKPSDPVTTKCTQICGGTRTGKSCAKVLLVKVFTEENPANAVKAYAIIDDQSNRSLAKTSLFNELEIHGEESQYTLASCSGQVTSAGRKAFGLMVESFDGSTRHKLPALIECDQIPNTREEIPTPEVVRHYQHLQDIALHFRPVDDNAEIQLLIGRDLIEAHHVFDQRTGPEHTPFAQRLSLGWVIIGETCLNGVHQPNSIVVNKTSVLPDGRPTLFTSCPIKRETKEHLNCVKDPTGLQADVFARTVDDDEVGTSIEDREFLEMMDKEFAKDEDGRWTAPLPFRQGRPRLPNNRPVALRRAKMLSANLQRDPAKRQHFTTFMGAIFEAGHAERAPPVPWGGECWYLPIFGVYHPKKPGHIRGVFDSAAKFEGISLNDILLTGPDQTNSLLGILLRFRQEAIAVMADIRQMFYCFKVPETQRNFLRFFWFKDNNPDSELVEYRMCVHVFGNSSSPAVATYGLRKTASVGKDTFGTDVVAFVTRNFYVDDGLTSLPTSQEAVSLIRRTQNALLHGGKMKLHKIASNSKEVLNAFPKEDLTTDLSDVDLSKNMDLAPTQRSLGVSWDLHADAFVFKLNSGDKQNSRRGVLSTINSIYDPLGFLAPVTVAGKLFLRDLVFRTTDWDSPLPDDMLSHWQEWKGSLAAVEQLKIPRTYRSLLRPSQELHVFADASEKSIAAVAFMRSIDGEECQVSIVLGKAKVAPKHATTMPRLELCAALLAATMSHFIQVNLDTVFDKIVHYSDSKVVLGYLSNRTKRFYIYVANRVQQILRWTRSDQWKYIPTHLNPADAGTRAVRADQLAESAWLRGPDFLHSKPNPTTQCLIQVTMASLKMTQKSDLMSLH